MKVIWRCNTKALAECIAREAGKNPSKVILANQSGDYLTFSPLEDEEKPSLSVRVESEKKCLVYRHGGSYSQDVYYKKVVEIGLKYGLCTPEESINHHTHPLNQKVEQLLEGEVEKLSREMNQTRQKLYKAGDRYYNRGIVEVAYDYKDEAGKILYQFLRLKGKDFAFNRRVSSQERVLYNLDLIFRARKAQESTLENTPSNNTPTGKSAPVFITEGEKDANTLTSKGLLATTCGGAIKRADKWKDSYSDSLKGLYCVVLTDRDEAGETSGGLIASRLFECEKCSGLKLVTFSSDEVPEKGDVTDYLNTHSLEEFLAKVENTPEYTANKEQILSFSDKVVLDAELKKFTFDISGNAQRVIAYTEGCISWVQEGGEITPFVYDSKKGIWRDSKNEALALTQIALRRIPEEILQKHQGLTGKDAERAFKWAKASQSPKAAKDALETSFSYKGNTLQASDFDLHPRNNNGKCLINCKNGIVDLTTGEIFEHSKDAHITQYCERVYDPSVVSPLWEKCLLDIFEGDQSLVDNFQLHIGYAAMGYPKEKAFFVLHGDSGDTGKSTVLETIKNVLGVDYAGEIPFSTIQIAEHQDSGKPDSFLSKVKKAHIVTISETETREGRRAALNFEKVKTLSGADSIPIRDLYKPATSFIPKFTLIIALNNKPQISDLKDSTWDRMRLFPFVHKFTGVEKDPDMGSKLLKEADGIFNWIVQGAIKYTQLGSLPKHQKVVEAVREYRAEETPLEVWFEECTTVGKGLTEKRELIDASIKRWFADYEDTPSPWKVTEFLKSRGIKTGGRYKRKALGLELKPREKLEQEKEGERLLKAI